MLKNLQKMVFGGKEPGGYRSGTRTDAAGEGWRHQSRDTAQHQDAPPGQGKTVRRDPALARGHGACVTCSSLPAQLDAWAH
jgi:hypothetical protein